MAFSPAGATMGLKLPSVGVAMRDLSVVPSPAVYATGDNAGQFFGEGDYPQQQREYLLQRNLMNPHDMSHVQHFNMNEGPKGSQPTHDFLSLYADNSSQYAEQHDAGRGLSCSLTTKDFLQPLERGGNHGPLREPQQLSRLEKHPRAESMPHGSAVAPAVVDRILSSSMGGYSGGHLPAYGRVNAPIELPTNSLVRMVGDSNVEAMRARAFNTTAGPLSSRDDHEARSDPAKDQDAAGARERAENHAHWSNVRLKFGMLPDMGFAPNSSSPSQNTIETVQPPVSTTPKQWPPVSQGMIDMSKRPTRVPSEDDEDDDEDYVDRGRENRKEPFQKVDTSQKLDSKNTEARGGTPRSKHSATEQRRRSKINDRFQMLRELVPHSDQKRDKASFLLEVIEYIQALQEKVRKYETAEHGRHQERLKNMVWDLCKRGTGPGDSTVDASHIDAMSFAKEFSPSGPGSLDVKQGGDAGDNRARVLSSAAMDENATSEQLSHNLQQVSRPSGNIHSSVPAHEEKDNIVTVGKSIPSSISSQHQASFGRSFAHAMPSKQLQSTPESQAMPESQGVNAATNTHPTTLYGQERGSEVEAMPVSRTRASGPIPQGESECVDQQKGDRRYPSSSCEKDGKNGLSSDEHVNASNSKAPAKLDRQNVFGNPQRNLQHASQTSEGLQLVEQNQQLEINDQFQPDEAQASASGQDPLTIQGGVINVSSVYSQGLLDTLTRALQSSGLDLSQANISVQIDLGKSIGTSAAGPSPKVGAVTPESSGQSHQSLSHARQVAPHSETEQPPLKRPKIEMEL